MFQTRRYLLAYQLPNGEAQAPVPSSLRVMGLLAAVTAACLLPFVNKAYHIDDPLFVWVARRIVHAPFDFYGFQVNWYGYAQPISEVVKNPPLFAYWLALAGWFGGWREWVMHVAGLVFSVGAVLGSYQVGRVLGARPALAALLTLFTPVFLISATQVMCDVPMLCLWLWGIYFWICGERLGDARRLWLAALLVGLCALTKYFGAALIPLLGVYSVARNGRPTGRLLPLLLPVTLLLGYQALTWRQYGVGLFADAARYAVAARAVQRAPLALIRGLIFTGGCLVSLLAVGPLLWRGRGLPAWGGGVAAVLALAASRACGPAAWRESLGVGRAAFPVMALFLVAGCGVAVLAVAEWRRSPTAESLLLLLWAAGTFVFGVWVNWSLNGRSLLPLAPSFALLVARRARADAERVPPLRWAAALLIAAAVAFVPARADERHAHCTRAAAGRILDRFSGSGGTVWFQGHWGFQYYMEEGGAKALDNKRLALRPGDVVVVPQNNAVDYLLQDVWFGEADTFYIQAMRRVACTDYNVGAGFYYDRIGPLPFGVGFIVPERYDVRPVRGYVVSPENEGRERGILP